MLIDRSSEGNGMGYNIDIHQKMVASLRLKGDFSFERISARHLFKVGSDGRNSILRRNVTRPLAIFIEASAGYHHIIAPKSVKITRYFDAKTLIFAHNTTFYCNKNTKFVENFAQFMNLSYICGLIA